MIRREKAARLYCQGKTQSEIAKELGTTPKTICEDLQWWRKELVATGLTDVQQGKVVELAKLDELERTCWEAWHRSCQEYEERSFRVRRALARNRESDEYGEPNPDMVVVEEVDETKQNKPMGDPRYLEQIHKCIQTRLRVLGLLSPDNNTNILIQTIDWKSLYAVPVEVLPDMKVIDHDASCPVEQAILEAESMEPAPSNALQETGEPGVNGKLNGKPHTNGDGHGGH